MPRKTLANAKQGAVLFRASMRPRPDAAENKAAGAAAAGMVKKLQ